MKKRFCKRFVQGCSETYIEFEDALADMENFINNELPVSARIITLTGDRHECLLVYELDEDTKRS